MTQVVPIILYPGPKGRGAAKVARLKDRLSLAPLLLESLRPAGKDTIATVVRTILATVRRRGDAALREYSRKWDAAVLAPGPLRVPREEIDAAARQADPALVRALRQSIANVRRYQQAMLPPPPPPLTPPGAQSTAARLAVRYEPLRRVGVYIPGGAAAYPSSVVMTVVPAQVAGVKSICLCSPLRAGRMEPTVLVAAAMLGVSEIHPVGGAQAIAAMAFGTESIPPVDKIVGPGNRYVQLAKKELFGLVAIDSFAGPSEVIVLADDSAEASVVAAELLAQAEHAPGSALLITASARLARAVQCELARQLAALPRREPTAQALRYASALIVTPSHRTAMALVNDFAPEHLQISTREPEADAEKISSAGAIFVGAFTPVAAGDYLAGPSHVLPTSGTARFFSGLAAESFRRRISLVQWDAAALATAAPAIETLALAEGFTAHARSVQARGRNAPRTRSRAPARSSGRR
jgi:histidinol dehydrogenase